MRLPTGGESAVRCVTLLYGRSTPGRGILSRLWVGMPVVDNSVVDVTGVNTSIFKISIM